MPTLTAAAHVAGFAANAAVGVAGQAGGKAKILLLDGKDKAEATLQRLKEVLEAWIKQALLSRAEQIVDKIPGVMKTQLEDEEMPRWVSQGKDRVVDSMWPDVRAEVLWEIAAFLDKAEEETELPGCDCFRAFFRYHMYPYDRSIWRKLRDPWFILFKLIPLIPIFAITPLWFLFVFIVIDKSDEFQLAKFILDFKGTAFISQGVVRAVVGFATFMSCVTARAKDADHDCESRGPGTTSEIWPTTGGFVFQIVLVWVALALICCSQRKGKAALKGTVVLEETGMAAVKGGYISYFVWYDLACFLICVSLVGYTISTRPHLDWDSWPVHHVVYAAQCLYSVLSVPFFLFTLPVLQRMLLHAFPTAYDPKGACRAPVKPVPSSREKGREEAEEVKREDFVSDADVEDLHTRIKRVLQAFGAQPGPSSGESSTE